MTTIDAAATLEALFTDVPTSEGREAPTSIETGLARLRQDLGARFPGKVHSEFVALGGTAPAPDASMVMLARGPNRAAGYQAVFLPSSLVDEALAVRLAEWRHEAAGFWSRVSKPALFQYWDRLERPGEIDGFMQAWARDPAFDYRAHTRESAMALIARWLPARVSDAFARCKVGAMQADLFRLCALYLFGGIYIDADIENLGQNDVLLERSGRGFLFRRHSNVANDVMVVHTPADPLMRHAMWRAVSNIEEGRLRSVWKATGPGILTAAYNELDAEDALFQGFRFGTARQIAKCIGFHWDLSYKKTADHWRALSGDQLITQQP